MIVTQEFRFTPDSIRALTPALERANFGWREVNEWMRGHGWCLWDIGGQAWVFTLVNADDEIEFLLAGGRGARECYRACLDAIEVHPAHKGLTMRIDSRPAWRRFLTDFEERDGVLFKRIAE